MKKLIQILLTILLSAPICFAQGFWSKVGDMPEIRQAHTVNELNGKIYIVGGSNTEASALPTTALVYNIASKEWSQIPLNNNKSRYCHCSCVINGKLYVLGGGDVLNSAATMDMYDPNTGEWTSKTPMSIDRGLPACAVMEDKIYVMGGMQVVGGNRDYSGLSKFEVYDTKNDTWTTLADMPTKRWGLSATAFNGKIYVFGGRSLGLPYSSIEIYDPQTNTWTTKSSMPTPRYCLTSCLLDSNIYVIGGWRHSQEGPIYDKVEVYNPQTNEWKTENSLPVKRAVLASLVLNGKIYVYGGARTTHPNIGTSDIYELSFDDIVAQNPTVDKPYAIKDVDSILFTTRFSNPNNHPFIASLIYANSDQSQMDSLILCDDGLHGDSLSGDGLYGTFIPPGLNEDFYSLSISTIDNNTNKYYCTPDRCRFTTVGPVVLDSIDYKKYANFYAVKAFVKNKSEIVTIKKPILKIICNDPWALPMITFVKAGNDIPPGGIESFGSAFQVKYNESIFPGYFNLKFEISSDGYHYWTDSVKTVVTAVNPNLQETTLNLEQNYPNPFHSVTTIKYTVPVASKVAIKIYDLIGKEIECLVNEEKPTGTYEVTWHAGNLPGGVYFYQINAGGLIETKKMVLKR